MVHGAKNLGDGGRGNGDQKYRHEKRQHDQSQQHGFAAHPFTRQGQSGVIDIDGQAAQGRGKFAALEQILLQQAGEVATLADRKPLRQPVKRLVIGHAVFGIGDIAGQHLAGERRDTPDLLGQYVAAFNSSYIGLRPANDAQLAQIAKDFRVYYAKSQGKTPDDYTMDHTAASYVFDKDGKLRLFARDGQGVEPWVHDLKLLVD